MDNEYTNIPPKDIQNAIWGACFDYKDFDTVIDEEAVRDRIYRAWNSMHLVLQGWIKADKEGFFNYIMTKTQPDMKLFNGGEEEK